jgi:glutathione synthetase
MQFCLFFPSRYSIKVIRQTFNELSQSALVDPVTSVLRISCSPDLYPGGLIEISTVYLRAGYMPDEYPEPTHYNTRFLLERSKAIKCPTIALQLAGGKKVQEVLTRPGVLERFLADKEKYGEHVFGEHEINELRLSFMAMWGLDVGDDMLTESGREEFGVRKARENALSLVLKPQREGGGNNVYKEAIPAFLDTLAPQERQAWIAMELIMPPDTGNYLIRARTAESETQAPVKTEVVSELGIYGWSLFGGPSKSVEEKQVGWLLRTKGKESNEGGVATGFSVLDSLLLID